MRLDRLPGGRDGRLLAVVVVGQGQHDGDDDDGGCDGAGGEKTLPVQSTSSAMVRRSWASPATSMVVTIDSFQASRSSRILSLGPTR